MNAEIIRRLSPEEEELAKKRNDLALLQTELAERELELANLRADLSAFEGLYLRDVGVLYAELDDWNARIAQLVAEGAGTVEVGLRRRKLARGRKNPTLPLMARLPEQSSSLPRQS